MNLKVSALLLFLTTILHSCFISKELETPVKARILTTPTVVVKNAGSSTFCSDYTNQELVDAYMERLKSELANSNVIIVESSSSAKYEISISTITVEESTVTETVNDTASDDHGESFELTTIDIRTSGEVTKLKSGKKRYWTAWKDKSEKVTSSRSAGQVITGSNKNKDEYREKDFPSNKCLDLIGDVGRRSGVNIVKKVIKFE